MKIRVLYFAVLADALGVREQTLDLDAGATVGDALVALAAQHAVLAAPGGAPAALAVNLAYAAEADVLADGDELALLPPVSGG
ncbi:MAG: MoaD/ThiS family protein [Algisphaera sp.]